MVFLRGSVIDLFKKENLGFAALQFIYWAVYCIFFPFIVPFLDEKGYSEFQIGLLMSLISVATIIGQPFWGHFIDRRSHKKNAFRNVMALSMLVAGLAALPIPSVVKIFPLLLALVFIISFTENSMQSIVDSWSIRVSSQKKWLDYGFTRGMGSVGYAITAAVFGAVLDKHGYGLIFPVHLVFALLAVAIIFWVGHQNKDVKAERESSAKIKIPFKSILKNTEFILFLVSSTLIYLGFRALGTFYPILMFEKGGNNTSLGISLFVMAVLEFPVFFLSKRLMRKYKDTSIILVSFFFFFIRILTHLMVNSVAGLILLQTTQGISFGLFLPASINYVGRLAPEELKSTYLTLASSAYFGLGSILGSFFGGIFLDLGGTNLMLQISLATTLVGFVFFALTPKKAGPLANPDKESR